jgi:hypothetical protein
MVLSNKARFKKVWNKFCDFYKKYGCKGMDKLWGGYFREESDIVFHLARFCAQEFGEGYVHLNSPIHKIYFNNFPGKRRQHIDIDLTDPNTFSTKNAKHGIFVEVKWIYKDFLRQPYGGERLKRMLISIEKDLEKLDENLKNGRCENAFMVIVDDEGRVDNKRIADWKKKYPSVQILLCQCKSVSPKLESASKDTSRDTLE